MTPTVRSLPEDAVIQCITSPAFDASPPRLLGQAHLPENVACVLEPIWSISHFPAAEIRIFHLKDVWVAKEGLVFDAEGNLFEETITQHTSSEIETAYEAVVTARCEPTMSTEFGPVALCKKRGIGNYGHWMLEMLPRAYLVHKNVEVSGLRFLIAKNSGRLAESMALSLMSIGIPPSQVIPADDTPRRFEQILMVDGLTHHGAFFSPLVLDPLEAIARPIPLGSPIKILVLRRSTGFRLLAEEDKIICHALERGYTVVDPGLMSLGDQIALFKRASRIVGIMGAAMTNIVFAAPSTPIVTVAPGGMMDTFFWFLAILRGLEYMEVRCPPIGPVRGNSPWDTDLFLDPALYGPVFDGT
ncbi:glycosyltransferase family 61 protein [Pararhodospirillum photometricum]|uniref:glycosyltransferase family 61 protein n=1 Tax=Pararhodospirillum photometricum TaxID=1084 RepID=UPI0009DA781D|nr:glycosyltransferase 61 family protein [Pararhodospirillum photometricum]